MANEKRLIDANSFSNGWRLAKFTEYNGRMRLIKTMQLQDAPTVNAVEVVRCRECKHAWIHPCGYVYCHRDGRNAYEMTFNLDSFCSYGELKEGDDND